MKAAHHGDVARLAVLALVLAAGAACTTEKTVYRDASATGPTPPAAAGNFAGYAKTDTKQTVCGNCHFDLQTAWVQTGHASAWQNLMASGHAADACKDCHSVSANGNGATVKVAYSATQDPRYQDVQCESCHGGGWLHVKAPSLGNRPLASIAVDTTAGTKFGCGSCHTGTHEPFVDQWKVSAHNFILDEAPAENPSYRTPCKNCHAGQGALAAFGLKTNYTEINSATPQPITCTVCHDPHSKTNGKQLRYSIATTDTSQNLCMKCHNRSPVPQWTSSRYGTSTHAPEAGTLLGYTGWFPAGYMTHPDSGGKIVSTHGSGANANTCGTCHVARFAVTDAANNLVFQATGHTFNATPCLDSLGRPLMGTGCSVQKMSFKSCTAGGCHGSEAAARSALTTATTRIETLVEELQAMVDKVPAGEKTALKFTVARGALFNISVAEGGDGAEVLDRIGINPIAGPAAHNPFLIEQLLTSSIKAVQATYGISPSANLVLSNTLQQR